MTGQDNIFSIVMILEHLNGGRYGRDHIGLVIVPFTITVACRMIAPRIIVAGPDQADRDNTLRSKFLCQRIQIVGRPPAVPVAVDENDQ